MDITGNINYKKALILTEDRIEELEKLLLKYYYGFYYEIITQEGSKYFFGSKEQMLQHDNYGKKRIRALIITGVGQDDHFPQFTLRFEYEKGYLGYIGYTKTCVFNYSLSTDDQEDSLRNNIFIFLKRSTASYWLIAKIRLCGLLVFSCTFLCTYGAIYKFSVGGYGGATGEGTILSLPLFLVLSLIALILMGTMRFLDHYFLENFFPPIIFSWGEEERLYEKRQRIGNNLFWGVLVAFIIGIITSRF